MTGLDPATMIISREPDGRWYVTFTVEVAIPPPLAATGHAVGVALGVRDFVVTSDGRRSPTRGTWSAGPGTWPATSPAVFQVA